MVMLNSLKKLVDEYGGKGTPIMDKNGRWTNKEKFDADDIIGTHVDSERIRDEDK